MTRLDKLEQLDRDATEGPWKYDGKYPVKIGYVARCPFANAVNNANFIAASREAVPALLDALAASARALAAAERRAMVAERRLAAGPAAVALKHIDDYGRAQWVNGREAKFRISYAEWWKLMVELGEVQP